MSREKLKLLEKRRKEILTAILSIDKMLKGSYHVVYTKCGKQNCRCFEGKGHPHSRITWTENGTSYISKVPVQYRDQVEKLTSSYKRVRELRKELSGLDKKCKALLDNYERMVVTNSRKKISFLKQYQ